jgi:hypothetical protein
MVVHKTPVTLRHTDKTAHAFIFGDAYNPVGGLFHRYRGTHFGTIAALIANFNPVIGTTLYHPDGAFFFVLLFEVSLGTNLLAGTTAGTFG